jgi:hypothetical protein
MENKSFRVSFPERVEIVSFTDDDYLEMDFIDYAQISSLNVGETCTAFDDTATVLRIS